MLQQSKDHHKLVAGNASPFHLQGDRLQSASGIHKWPGGMLAENNMS